MLKLYFSGFSLLPTPAFTTEWIDLQMGKAMGCTILPILFATTILVILNTMPGVAQGPRLNEESKLLSLKTFMDDTALAVPN